MTIGLNGKSHDTETIKNRAGTDSWLSPSEYIDPLTGAVHTAPTLPDLLTKLETSGVGLFDNEAMRKRGLNPGGADDGQWDNLLIHLDAYPSPEDARRIIIDTLANPDVTYLKSGKKTHTVFKGKRAVIAHEVHHDDARGPHFMAVVHTVALTPQGTTTPKASFGWGYARGPMVDQINEALAANGLAPMVFRALDDKPENVAAKQAQLTAEQSQDFREAIQVGEVPELDVDDLPELAPSARKEHIRKAAIDAGTAAATLWAQAREQAQKSKTYENALSALENEERLTATVGLLQTKLAEATTRARETLEAQAVEVSALTGENLELATELETTNTQLQATQQKAAQLSEQVDTFKAENKELSDELKGARAEVAQAEELQEVTANERDDWRNKAGAFESQAHESLERAAAAEKNFTAERLGRKNDAAEHANELKEITTAHGVELRDVKAKAKQENDALRDLVKDKSNEAKSEKTRADKAETAQSKAEGELAKLREQLAAQQAASKAQAAELARERTARTQAEKAARDALGAKATAEAQLAARPTQEALQAALSGQAKAEGERNALAERVTALLQSNDNKPAPSGGNKPKA